MNINLQVELQQCRALLEMLGGKIAAIEHQLFHSSDNIGISGSPLFQPGSSTGIGNSHPFQSGDSTGMGGSHSFQSGLPVGMGGSPAFQSLAGVGMGGSASFSTPTPEALAQLLKAGEMKPLSPRQVRNAATFICHLYSQPTGNSHEAIAQLTGMSTSGVGKMLMALHRRGLIQKQGWRHFVLTNKAVGYLREAG